MQNERKQKLNLDNYIKEQIADIVAKVGSKRVLLGLSGGVDSSVCAALIAKAIPNQLVCVFVDTGLMRLNEGNEIEAIFGKKDVEFVRVNAEDYFLEKLKGVVEPEQKRKIIGEAFIRVFEEQSKKLQNISFLGQGTIYPDIVESKNDKGEVIKSHHNVGGLPEDLGFEGLVEPLAGLYKSEVRAVGLKLGLPAHLINRQPFPGPGLGVRVIGDITKEKCDTLRKADAILREELDKLAKKPNQYFAVLTNTDSVGVKNDKRTYNKVIALRAVVTDNFMSATYAHIPHKTLSLISDRITSELDNVSRVVYDITNKPPSTIEWE